MQRKLPINIEPAGGSAGIDFPGKRGAVVQEKIFPVYDGHAHGRLPFDLQALGLRKLLSHVYVIVRHEVA